MSERRRLAIGTVAAVAKHERSGAEVELDHGGCARLSRDAICATRIGCAAHRASWCSGPRVGIKR